MRAKEVNVRTTPFTCGCQASVAINIRMTGTSRELADSRFLTFGQGYFKRMTSSMCKDVFPAASMFFPVT
jgi:hypothetical protein